FNWAMEGLLRVRARGRLCQPKSAAAAVQDLRSTGSRIQAFADAVGLQAGEGLAVSKQELFGKWTTWCAENNLRPGNPQLFGRDLRTVFPQVRDGKAAGSDGKRVNSYLGIGLACPDCPECPDDQISSGQTLLPRVA